MADPYLYLRLQAADRDSRTLQERLLGDALPAWQGAGIRCWGVWQGLFGIGSNELLVMLTARDDGLIPDDFRGGLPHDADVVDVLPLLSTVRPDTTAALPAEGLYVFRFFDVREPDCDEIVELSREAWESFEDTDRYLSRPQGLFRPRNGGGAPDGAARMLLVTWYDGFRSWEISRAPAPEARDDFRRRHALTTGTIAYATRLVTRDPGGNSAGG